MAAVRPAIASVAAVRQPARQSEAKWLRLQHAVSALSQTAFLRQNPKQPHATVQIDCPRSGLERDYGQANWCEVRLGQRPAQTASIHQQVTGPPLTCGSRLQATCEHQVSCTAVCHPAQRSGQHTQALRVGLALEHIPLGAGTHQRHACSALRAHTSTRCQPAAAFVVCGAARRLVGRPHPPRHSRLYYMVSEQCLRGRLPIVLGKRLYIPIVCRLELRASTHLGRPPAVHLRDSAQAPWHAAAPSAAPAAAAGRAVQTGGTRRPASATPAPASAGRWAGRWRGLTGPAQPRQPRW